MAAAQPRTGKCFGDCAELPYHIHIHTSARFVRVYTVKCVYEFNARPPSPLYAHTHNNMVHLLHGSVKRLRVKLLRRPASDHRNHVDVDDVVVYYDDMMTDRKSNAARRLCSDNDDLRNRRFVCTSFQCAAPLRPNTARHRRRRRCLWAAAGASRRE